MNPTTEERPDSRLLGVLRCPGCHGELEPGREGDAGRSLACPACAETYPVIDGIPRMLIGPMRKALLEGGKVAGAEARKAATAESFGYEWTRFSVMRDEWERNFLEYMAPHSPEFFRGKRVLDAGCGSGRHSYYAAKFGADVVSVDLGPAVEVTRRNTEPFGTVQVVQSDLCHLPFAPESFDLVYSLGVLHHLPEPEAGFRGLLPYLKPGGEMRVYLYWTPEGQPLKRVLLSVVSAVRQVTTRIPHGLLHALSYPAAALAFGVFVWPHRVLKHVPGLRALAERIPMKQYANYPFGVCVNDQFDRFSAPIENRYTRAEVEAWFQRAGLEDVSVFPLFGWVASGRKPVAGAVVH